MKWINVKDRMPKLKKFGEQSESKYVDIKLADGTEDVAWYNTVSGWENMNAKFDNVTHWKNIPKEKQNP